MRRRALFFVLLLHSASAADGLDSTNVGPKSPTADKEEGRYGFLERAFQEAKRVGMAIDPEAVAQAEQAWKGLEPDLRQAAGDALQAEAEFQAVGKEVEGLWSDVQHALSGSDADGVAQGNAGLEWEGLKRGASKAAKEVLGEGPKSPTADKEEGRYGFLERAFQEAKRVGMAIDPEAVAQAEQAWKGLEPDLRQAAGDALQAKAEFQAVGKEVEGLWSDVQRALSGSDADGVAQGNAELEWEGLKRGASEAAKEVLGEGPKSPTADKEEGRYGFLERAFQEAKRVGMVIDPEAVAQAEQAWKGLEPDLRQAAGDALQAKEEFQAVGKEVEGLWSDVQRALSGSDADGVAQGNAGLEWEGLKRDASKAAKEVLGEAVTDASNEIVSKFESHLSEALSEGNIRTASELWRRLLDYPGVQFLVREQKLWAGAKQAVQRYLNEYMSEESNVMAERAVNATTNFAVHFAGLGRNAGKTQYEVFQDLSHKLCHLQGAVEKLWPLALPYLPLLGYEEYAAGAESAIRAKALSRLSLTVSASALLGLDPRDDPFLMTVIASYSLGHLTKDVAQNMAALFQKAFEDPLRFGQAAGSEKGAALMSPADLATELVSGTDSCEELAHHAYAFFEGVGRALAGSSPPGGNGSPAEEASTPTLLDSPPGNPPPSPRPERELAMDGFLFRLAIWAAAAVDHPRFSPESFLFFFVVCSVCCALGTVLCWRRWRTSRGSQGPASKRPKTA